MVPEENKQAADASAELRLVVVSGLSGSGKSHALKCFEDLGFFCVDNLPPSLLPVFVDLCLRSSSRILKAAIGIDIREREFLSDFLSVSETMASRAIHSELLFLEAREEVLIRRFSETRRPHPLAGSRPVAEGIQMERERLADLRKRADRIIDTSDYNIHQLKGVLTQYYVDKGKTGKPTISIVSFGYKFGIPSDTDFVFDIRFLQNPNGEEDLRPLSGLDSAVRNYVFQRPEAEKFLGYLRSLLEFLVPFFEKEGRAFLTLAVGCTGGRHRSVALAARLQDDLKNDGFEVVIRHRDINRER